MSKILTISIAAYNMEKYIRQALDSLIDRRIIDDLEVFIIDDGGTDRTLEIAKEYAEKYPNSIFPVHKENGGYGSTVNYSVANATGKYFKLLDGDDWFDTEAFIELIEILKKVDSDIFVTPYFKVINGVKKKIEQAGIPKNQLLQICDIADKIKLLVHQSLTVKTKLLQDANIELPLKINYTDSIFVFKAFEHARMIYYCDPCVCCYRLAREGQSSSKASRAKHYKEEMYVYFIIAELYESCKSNHNPNLRALLRQGMISYCLVFRDIMCCNYKSAYALFKKFEKDAKEASGDIYSAAGTKGYEKICLLIKLLRTTNNLAFPAVKLLCNIRFRKPR